MTEVDILENPKQLLIIHDVLQGSGYGDSQRREFGKKKIFDDFLETMRPLEGNNNVVLLVVAGEMDKFPEWVEYIKQHPEWRIECHGWVHCEHTRKKEDQVTEELTKAKAMIEKVFSKKVTWFFPPRKKYNEMVERSANKAGMKLWKPMRGIGKSTLRRPFSFSWADVHYWYPVNRITLKKLLEYKKIESPIFIIGAPRSGTTALMRLMGEKAKGSITLKEVEKIWHSKYGVKNYYLDVLNKTGKNIIIDKNVRNSLRLSKILRVFPSAKFIHIIRDGRASANSWRKWAIKTEKENQTLEHAAKQWVYYVETILKYKSLMKNYEEIRYEDLCEKEKCFVSRNFKWKKELTVKEIETVENIQSKLLKELGYL